MTKPFESVGVIGAGTMGQGIALVSALAGYKVHLFDVQPEQLDSAKSSIEGGVQREIDKGRLNADALSKVKSLIDYTPNIYELGEQAELNIEAVPEDLALKQKIFKQLDELSPQGSVLASNTSSLSIAALAGVTKCLGRVAGLHFFNPVARMKLVEIIRTPSTSDNVVDRLTAFVESLGKTPVLAKDTPGFIVNRVARSFYGEALRLLDDGVASVETIDQIMTGEGGFAMGPFQLMDLIGIDVNYAVSQSVYNATFHEPRFKPHPRQRQMVESGRLGRKTGEGFYRYEHA